MSYAKKKMALEIGGIGFAYSNFSQMDTEPSDLNNIELMQGKRHVQNLSDIT